MAIFYDLYAGGSGELCAPDSVFKHTPALLQGRRITAVLPGLLHDTLLKALVRRRRHIVSSVRIRSESHGPNLQTLSRVVDIYHC